MILSANYLFCKIPIKKEFKKAPKQTETAVFSFLKTKRGCPTYG